MMKTAQIISWLRDKAARGGDHSQRRMLTAAAERLTHYEGATECIRQLHASAKGLRKCVLEDVLEILEEVHT